MFGTKLPHIGLKEYPTEEIEVKEEAFDNMTESDSTMPLKQVSRIRGISCKICSKIYSERNPPLILLCGHSCCTSCLAQIIDTNKICYACKRGLAHLDVSHYPINYTVLEVSEEYSSVNNFRKRIESLHNVHHKILSAAESSVSNVLANMDKVESMKLNVPKLLDLMATDDAIINVKEADAELDNIERLMKEVLKIFAIQNENYLQGKSEAGVQFHLHSSKFKTKKDFLTKIYNEIINGNRIVAYKIIDGVDSFAKVSVEGSLILLHAFRSSPKHDLNESLSQDGHFTSFPEEGQAKVIEFEDFKNATRWMKLRAFIDGNGGKRLFIDILSQSVRSYFFTQFSTGETGTSYLRGLIKSGQGPITTVKINEGYETLKWNDRYLEYLAKEDCYFNCVSGKTYAEFTLDGTIHLRSDLCGNNKNICGLVVNPEKLYPYYLFDLNTHCVHDCGIGHMF